MKQIKIFVGKSEKIIESEINSWIKENEIDVLDIKVSPITENSPYSKVMIIVIYKDN